MYHDIFGMMNDEILSYALSLNDQLIDQLFSISITTLNYI